MAEHKWVRMIDDLYRTEVPGGHLYRYADCIVFVPTPKAAKTSIFPPQNTVPGTGPRKDGFHYGAGEVRAPYRGEQAQAPEQAKPPVPSLQAVIDAEFEEVAQKEPYRGPMRCGGGGTGPT